MTFSTTVSVVNSQIISQHTRIGHEGLEIAYLGDLPNQVREEATRVAHKLAEIETRRDEGSGMGQVAARRKALLRVSYCKSIAGSL
jgi:hypothetical protein